MSKETTTIKNFYGQIVGYVETDTATGNKTIRNFYRQILGYYDKKRDVTLNFYRQIVARGDASTSLIDMTGKN